VAIAAIGAKLVVQEYLVAQECARVIVRHTNLVHRIGAPLFSSAFSEEL
jgi:hypothetical protein